MAKDQKTCLVCLSHRQPSSCFRPMHKSGFVHLFTWPSNGYDWDAGGLTLILRCVLSNKTSCKSFGDHLLPQISCWSQALQTVLVLDSSGNGYVWTPEAPPFELKILWHEITSKYDQMAIKICSQITLLWSFYPAKEGIKIPLPGY